MAENWLHSKNVKMLGGDLGREKCLCDGLMLVLQSEKNFKKQKSMKKQLLLVHLFIWAVLTETHCGKHYGRQWDLKGTRSGSPCGKAHRLGRGSVSPWQWEKKESRWRAFLFCGPATFSRIHTHPE